TLVLRRRLSMMDDPHGDGASYRCRVVAISDLHLGGLPKSNRSSSWTRSACSTYRRTRLPSHLSVEAIARAANCQHRDEYTQRDQASCWPSDSPAIAWSEELFKNSAYRIRRVPISSSTTLALLDVAYSVAALAVHPACFGCSKKRHSLPRKATDKI